MNNTVFLEEEDLQKTGFDNIAEIVSFVVENLGTLSDDVRALFVQKKGTYYGDYTQFFVEFDVVPDPQTENTVYSSVSSAVFEKFEKDAYFDAVGSASFAEVEKDVVRVWEH